MKSKKIVALMMTILMLLSLIPTASVFAATSCEVGIGTVTAEPGSTVIVPISITKMPYELGAATIWIDYDHTKLELIEIDPINKTEGGIITMDSDLVTALGDSIQAPGVVQLFWFDNVYGGTADNHIKTTGLFANLVFTVSADAEGTLPITLNPETYFTKYDYMDDTWDVSAVNDGGAVNVASATTSTPEPTIAPTPEPTVEPTAEPTAVPTVEPVNKEPLAEKLVEGNNLYTIASANIGTAPGQYDATLVAALYAAIQTAQDVYDDMGKSQPEVDAAVSDLQLAMIACVPNSATATPEPTIAPMGPCEIEIGAVSGAPGSSVVVPVRLNRIPFELGATTILLNYDHTKLELTSIDPVTKDEGGIITLDSDLVTALGDSIQEPGLVQLFWFDNVYGGTADNHIKTAGLFANLVFTVSADANGVIPITLNPETYITKFDYTEDTWEVSSINGGVDTGIPVPDPTATPDPTAEPTPEPTVAPTPEPTAEPTLEPTASPTAEPVNKEALAEKLIEGNNLYAIASANIGTAPGQYDATLVAALYAAIQTAQDVYDDISTQPEVDAAVLDLQLAITACVPNSATATPEPTIAPMGPGEIEIGVVSGAPGSSVVVPVKLSRIPFELGATMILLNYDHTKLELTSIDPVTKEEGGIITLDSDLITALEDSIQGPGLVQLFWFDNVYGGTADNHIKTAGLFANLVFTVKVDANGVIPITLNPETYITKFDYTEDTWEVSSINGGVDTGIPAPDPTATPAPTPITDIPEENIEVNEGLAVEHPYGKAGASLVRVDVTGIIDPSSENKVVLVKGIEARYTYYNGVYKFVALVEGAVEVSDVSIAAGTPTRLWYGDVNFDGEATSTDMNLLKGALAGNRTPVNNFEYLASDVNGDGELTSTDMNLLKGFLAGNLLTLPAFNK